MDKEDVVHAHMHMKYAYFICSEILLSHKNESDSFVVMWKNLGSVIRSEVSQKNKY